MRCVDVARVGYCLDMSVEEVEKIGPPDHPRIPRSKLGPEVLPEDDDARVDPLLVTQGVAPVIGGCKVDENGVQRCSVRPSLWVRYREELLAPERCATGLRENLVVHPVDCVSCAPFRGFLLLLHNYRLCKRFGGIDQPCGPVVEGEYLCERNVRKSQNVCLLLTSPLLRALALLKVIFNLLALHVEVQSKR